MLVYWQMFGGVDANGVCSGALYVLDFLLNRWIKPQVMVRLHHIFLVIACVKRCLRDLEKLMYPTRQSFMVSMPPPL